MTIKVVVDTNVLIAGLIGANSPNRQILRLCLEGELQPYVGVALYMEYSDLLNRSNIQALCKQTPVSLQAFLDGFAKICQPATTLYLWRPNLKDEADNHLVELAIATQAEYIVTNNTQDFAQAELKRLGYDVIKPEDLLRLLKK